MTASRAIFEEVEQRLTGTYTAKDQLESSGGRAQRRFLAWHAVIQQPCWACGRESSQLEAASSDYTLGKGASSYTCPSCTAPMECSTPFVHVGPCSWYWSRPANVRSTGWSEVANGEVER